MGQLKRKSQVLDTQFSRRTKSMRMISPSGSTIESLPEDLLVEIIAKAGANSLSNLFNIKLATKKFLHASEDGKVYRHVSLKELRKTWKNSAKSQSFIETCNDNKNPEALYRTGMLEFFTNCNEDYGISKLKASAENNHVEACYVYGAVLYSTYSKDEGSKLLKMCEDESGVRMVECRRRVKEFVSTIWMNNRIFSSKKDSTHWRRDCLNKNNCRSSHRINGWDWNDEDNYYEKHTCESCKWNCEVSRFCNMLNSGSYN